MTLVFSDKEPSSLLNDCQSCVCYVYFDANIEFNAESQWVILAILSLSLNDASDKRKACQDKCYLDSTIEVSLNFPRMITACLVFLLFLMFLF